MLIGLNQITLLQSTNAKSNTYILYLWLHWPFTFSVLLLFSLLGALKPLSKTTRTHSGQYHIFQGYLSASDPSSSMPIRRSNGPLIPRPSHHTILRRWHYCSLQKHGGAHWSGTNSHITSRCVGFDHQSREIPSLSSVHGNVVLSKNAFIWSVTVALEMIHHLTHTYLFSKLWSTTVSNQDI